MQRIAQRISTPKFQRIILGYYREFGREFPWRSTRDPYEILVSEVMLQQTQTERVRGYYHRFLNAFPSLSALAQAPLAAVLKEWSGLGYNRRALALKKLAEMVVQERGGVLPCTEAELRALPGIGPYTAGALLAFAFNQPSFIVETNIRAVFLYFFFSRAKKVGDKEILKLVQKTFYFKEPRTWYYALMDYGVKLKAEHPNLNKRSAHYKKQPPFKGSAREIRGAILKYLSVQGRCTRRILEREIGVDKNRMSTELLRLEQEGFLVSEGALLSLGDRA